MSTHFRLLNATLKGWHLAKSVLCQVKKDTFLIRGYASKYVEIRVGYNNKKLNFSSVSDSYIITDVMKKDSTINITIEWK